MGRARVPPPPESHLDAGSGLLSPAATLDRERRLSWGLLASGLVLLAALVRLPDLGGPSLWWDECHSIDTALQVRSAAPGRVAESVSRGFSIYFLLLAPWVDESTPEWLLRLPSAAAGILLVVAAAELGRAIGGRSLAWRMGLLAALSPMLAWHAREARWYSLTWLLLTLGAVAFAKALRGGGWGTVVVCLGCGLLAAATYVPAIVLPVVELVILGVTSVLARSRNTRAGSGPSGRRAAVVAGFSILLAVGGVWAWRTLVAPLLAAGIEGYRFQNLGGVRPTALAATLAAFASGYSLGPGPREWHTARWGGSGLLDLTLLLLAAAAFIFLAVSGYRALSATGEAVLARSMALLGLLPVAAVVAASFWTDHRYAPRHAGLSLPFLLVLVAAGTLRLGKGQAVRAVAAILLVALQTVALGQMLLGRRYAREDVRAAARFVESQSGPEDRVLVLGGINLPFRHYYRGSAAWRFVDPLRGEMEWKSFLSVAGPADTSSLFTVEGRVWDIPGSEIALSALDAAVAPSESFDFDGVRVTRRPLRDAAAPRDADVSNDY